MFTILIFVNCEESCNKNIQSQFEKANILYKKNKLNDAEKIYKNILTEKCYNYAVFYNLGNIYIQKKQLGKAIYCYRIAILLNGMSYSVADNVTKISL